MANLSRRTLANTVAWYSGWNHIRTVIRGTQGLRLSRNVLVLITCAASSSVFLRFRGTRKSFLFDNCLGISAATRRDWNNMKVATIQFVRGKYDRFDITLHRKH